MQREVPLCRKLLPDPPKFVSLTPFTRCCGKSPMPRSRSPRSSGWPTSTAARFIKATPPYPICSKSSNSRCALPFWTAMCRRRKRRTHCRRIPARWPSSFCAMKWNESLCSAATTATCARSGLSATPSAKSWSRRLHDSKYGTKRHCATSAAHRAFLHRCFVNA